MLLELINTDNLKLLQVGGAITGNSNQIATKYFDSRQLPGKARDVIVISNFLKKGLTLLEYKAIYYHEEGHYALKHNSDNSLPLKIKELQADAYASRKVGAINVLSALQKIPNIIRVCEPLYLEAIKTKSSETYFKTLDNFLNDTIHQMQFRYDALKILS